jgi:hypothetical protein
MPTARFWAQFAAADNQLLGTIPSEVNNMLNIQTFSLHSSSGVQGLLRGKVPSFANSTYLSKLYLGSNQLTGSIPSDFLLNNIAKGAVSVELDENLLTGTIPAHLSNLEELNINVIGNKVEGPIPSEFCKKGKWMAGLVEEFGCDAIACSPGSYNAVGRQTSATQPCEQCPGGIATENVLGMTQCLNAQGENIADDQEPVDPARILVNFYLDLEGSQWDLRTGWDVLDDLLQRGELDKISLDGLEFCRFYGVTCGTVRNEVKYLRLPGNNLQGNLPMSIFTLPGLLGVDLSYNDISVDAVANGGFDSLRFASTLTSLQLQETGLKTLVGIEKGKSLQELVRKQPAALDSNNQQTSTSH